MTVLLGEQKFLSILVGETIMKFQYKHAKKKTITPT